MLYLFSGWSRCTERRSWSTERSRWVSRWLQGWKNSRDRATSSRWSFCSSWKGRRIGHFKLCARIRSLRREENIGWGERCWKYNAFNRLNVMKSVGDGINVMTLKKQSRRPRGSLFIQKITRRLLRKATASRNILKLILTFIKHTPDLQVHT